MREGLGLAKPPFQSIHIEYHVALCHKFSESGERREG